MEKAPSQKCWSIGCPGIPCCPWKISKHTSTPVVVGYWAFNQWMACSALDALGLMLVFPCFPMIVLGVKFHISQKKCIIFFSESHWRRFSSKVTLMRMFLLQGCVCTHVSRCFWLFLYETISVQDHQYPPYTLITLSLQYFALSIWHCSHKHFEWSCRFSVVFLPISFHQVQNVNSHAYPSNLIRSFTFFVACDL